MHIAISGEACCTQWLRFRNHPDSSEGSETFISEIVYCTRAVTPNASHVGLRWPVVTWEMSDEYSFVAACLYPRPCISFCGDHAFPMSAAVIGLLTVMVWVGIGPLGVIGLGEYWSAVVTILVVVRDGAGSGRLLVMTLDLC